MRPMDRQGALLRAKAALYLVFAVLLAFGSFSPPPALAAGAIAGTVFEPNGTSPARFARVAYASAVMMNPVMNMVTADITGAFTTPALPAGEYILQAQPPHNSSFFGPSSIARVTVGNGSTSVDLRLTRPSIVGRALAPDGATPVSMAVVGVRNADLSVGKDTLTRSDGTFSISGLPTNTYTVTVRSPWGHSGLIPPPPKSVEVTPGTTANAGDFVFQAARQRIVGNIINQEGGPVTSAVVVASKQNSTGFASSPVTTTRAYSYSLDVSPGTWMVNIVPDRRSGAPPPDWIYSLSPIPVTFDIASSAPITKRVDITVTGANAWLAGQLVKPDLSAFEANSAFVAAFNERGRVNGAAVAEDGRFRIPLRDGTYRLAIEIKDRTLVAPSDIRVTLPPGETDLGAIPLRSRNARIEGQVLDNNGQGVADIVVRAWRRGSMQIASAKTITDGIFSLAVISGTWEVSPVPERDSRYILAEPPAVVRVTDSETKAITLHVLLADATIEGRVVDESSGEVIDDLSGFATALQGRRPVGGGAIRNGLFTIFLPSGYYTVTAGFPAGSGYRLADNVNVDLSAGETEAVTLTVASSNATIRGQLKNISGQPQTGLNASVMAGDGEGGHQLARVNPVSASYAMSVTADTWHMHASADPASNFFVRPRFNNTASVAANGTAEYDFTVVHYSGILSGTVSGPGGPLRGAWVFVDEITNLTTSPRFMASAQTDSQGRYRFRMPAGNFRIRSSAPYGADLIAPTPISVTIVPGAREVRDLTYRQADAEIVGTVYLTGTPQAALVWGYSENGGRSWFTTEDGSFRLPASRNETWYVGAVAEEGRTAFRTELLTVTIANVVSVTQNLDLTLWQDLPESQSVSFDAASMQIVNLADGAEIQIPAGAMAVSGTVTVRAAPKAMLVREQSRRPIGLAYVLTALDDDEQSISKFNQNVNIVLFYTDDQLANLGLTEDDLVPSYWDEVGGTWQQVENVVVDQANNRVTLIVDHFTDYALLGASSVPAGSGVSYVYLPAVLKSYTGGW